MRSNITMRRAVLVLKGFSDWKYTLAPECPTHDEPILSRLAAELHFTLRQMEPLSGPSKVRASDSYERLTREELNVLREKYSRACPIQRINLGPLTTGFVLECFGKNQQEKQGSGLRQDVDKKNVTAENSLQSQSEREADQSWRHLEVKRTTLDSGVPWISIQQHSGNVPSETEEYTTLSATFGDALCCSPIKRTNKEKKKRQGMDDHLWLPERTFMERIKGIQYEGVERMEVRVVKPLAQFTTCLMDALVEAWNRCKYPESKQKFSSKIRQ